MIEMEREERDGSERRKSAKEQRLLCVCARDAADGGGVPASSGVPAAPRAREEFAGAPWGIWAAVRSLVLRASPPPPFLTGVDA